METLIKICQPTTLWRGPGFSMSESSLKGLLAGAVIHWPLVIWRKAKRLLRSLQVKPGNLERHTKRLWFRPDLLRQRPWHFFRSVALRQIPLRLREEPPEKLASAFTPSEARSLLMFDTSWTNASSRSGSLNLKSRWPNPSGSSGKHTRNSSQKWDRAFQSRLHLHNIPRRKSPSTDQGE